MTEKSFVEFMWLLTLWTIAIGFGGIIIWLAIMIATDQKRVNKDRIKRMLAEIKNDKDEFAAIKALLNNNKPAESGYVPLLLLDGEMMFNNGFRHLPNIPYMINGNGNKITPYWQKIFQQMEENGWNVKKLKI